jgi:hypothetical protein
MNIVSQLPIASTSHNSSQKQISPPGNVLAKVTSEYLRKTSEFAQAVDIPHVLHVHQIPDISILMARNTAVEARLRGTSSKRGDLDCHRA